MLEGGGPLVESNYFEICIEQEKYSESHRRTYNKYLECNKPELKKELEEYLETDMDTPFDNAMNGFCTIASVIFVVICVGQVIHQYY